MTKPENIKCPNCDGEMISRKSQYGTFWGCKDYPRCKGTRDSLGRSKAEREQERKKDIESDYEYDERDEGNRFSFKRIR